MAGKIYSFYRTSPARTSLVHPTSGRNPLVYRAVVLMLLITGMMGAFVYRLSELQIFAGEHNRELAEQNRVRRIPLVSDRGTVSDRHGKLLASSQISRYVYLWPRQHSPREWQEIAVRLSPTLDVSPQEILSRLEKAGYTSLLPVRVGRQLSPDVFVAVAEQLPKWPGVEILTGSSRKYPNNGLAAHVLGYIGEATEADMAENPDYPSGMIVGKMGIERLANAQLQGKWGGRLVEVDARGQESRLLGEQPPLSGESVRLTLDLDLQRTAEKALGGRRGAAVVLNVKTGEVLALASSPTFDPNMFTRSVTEAEWQKLQKGDQPFLNRALQGYPPGSTFKVVTAAAGMESGKFSPQSRVGTSAFLSVGGHQFWESSRRGFGSIGFRDALAYSSNTFFFRVGMSVGPEAIARWGKALGIGAESKLGLEGASLGSMPTPDEKEDLYGEPWYLGDTISMSIGQGLVQATPLELAVMTAAIANGGQRVQPHLLMSQTQQPDMQPVPTGIKPETIKAIQEGLVAVVQKGTGRRLNDGSIPLTAGKTGTSEVGPGRKPNAMYIGYGPVSDPQIAIAVVVENGGYGGVAALPVAHEVFKVYFSQK
ncbi:MAG: penicillin-binding protein 2 [Cyanobacteria bacterium J069]|nr:MAG: penicillin-binding protein 2 [Cyanobacteria bacterium J069]